MKKRGLAIFGVVLPFMLLLSACNNGSSGAVNAAREEVMAEAYMPEAETWAAAENTGASYSDEDAFFDDAEGGFDGAASKMASNTERDMAESDASASRKLIRTVSLSFETDRFDAFAAEIEQKAKELGGYVESSDISGNSQGSYGKTASYTLRIPSDKLDAFLLFSEGVGNLVRKYETTEDITLQYYDIESRKAVLETEYDRILKLLSEAESMDSIISLESRLSDIRYQLESYGSDLRVYDNRVSYATVYLDVSEKKIMTPVEEAGFAQRVSAGFQESILDMQDGIIDIMVFLISNLPQILFTILILFLLYLFIRWMIKRLMAVGERQQRLHYPQGMAMNVPQAMPMQPGMPVQQAGTMQPGMEKAGDAPASMPEGKEGVRAADQADGGV